MPVLGNGAAWLSWLGLTRPTRFPGDPHETQKNHQMPSRQQPIVPGNSVGAQNTDVGFPWWLS